jgi:hypothetical protein
MPKKVSNIATSIKNRSTPQDVYYTPQAVVKSHLQECVPYYKEGDLVYDPFFGQGAYYNLYDEFFTNCRKEYSEITMGKDFFEYEGRPDIIVSNPPFSILKQVLDRLLEIRPKCISLLLGGLNLTPRRMSMMRDAGYRLVAFRVESVGSWFGRTIIVTWVLSEHETLPLPLCRFTWGEVNHKTT